MPARSNASALLQKVNSQLRGERVPLKTKEEDELATYLSGLTQRTQQARSLDFDDQGEVSLSSGADGLKASKTAQAGGNVGKHVKVSSAGSKFLKKKKPADDDVSDNESLSPGRRSREGIIIAGSRRDDVKRKSQTKSNLRHQISGADSDSDESLRGSEIGVRPGSADTSIGRDGPKFLKNRRSVEEDARSSLRSPSPHMFHRSSSADGKKKKKKKKESQGVDDKTKGEIVRTLGHVYLTSEEESLAEFIHGLSVSESSAKRPQNLVAKKQQKWRKKVPGSQPKLVRSSSSVNQRSRSPSPFKRSPSPFGKPLSRSLSQDSDVMLDSMASEIIEDRQAKRQRSRRGSPSSEDNFKLNLMDVASLIPSSPRHKPGEKGSSKKRSSSASEKKKNRGRTSSSSSFKASEKREKEKRKKSGLKKTESKASLFENLGIHMVDELMPDPGAGNSGGDSDSEIKTERSDDRKQASHAYSESEIITEIGAGNVRKPTAATPFRAIVAQSVSELIGSGSHPAKQVPETEPEDTDVGDDYSESFVSSTEDSQTMASSITPRSRGRTGRRTERSISRDDDSYSKRSHNKRVRQKGERKLIVEEKRVDVSTADGMHHWNSLLTDVHITGPYGLQYVDPRPVATQVVSADALEAITSYNPSILALQDMMRTQLGLVKNFVDIQNRIYKSCLDGLSYDHKYTTLEDTKAYIQEHRKPRMTFKDALKLVEQEEKNSLA